jgi:hypothetical protein
VSLAYFRFVQILANQSEEFELRSAAIDPQAGFGVCARRHLARDKCTQKYAVTWSTAHFVTAILLQTSIKQPHHMKFI